MPKEPSPTSTSPLASVIPPSHPDSLTNLQTAWVDVVEVVGEENVSTDQADLDNHSGSDWSSYNEEDSERPFMIVRPSTTDEVSRIVQMCHERVIPVTAYSGGTSLEGHFSPTRGGICIDFSRMDKILQVHKDDLDIWTLWCSQRWAGSFSMKNLRKITSFSLLIQARGL